MIVVVVVAVAVVVVVVVAEVATRHQVGGTVDAIHGYMTVAKAECGSIWGDHQPQQTSYCAAMTQDARME